MKKAYLILLAILSVTIGFTQEQVKFKATIENPNSQKLYFKNAKGKVVKEINQSGKGQFESLLDLNKGIYILDDGAEYTLIYLENGFDLNLKMDAKQFDESIVYTGKGSNENNYLVQKSLTNEEYWGKMNNVSNKQDLDNLIFDFKKILKTRLASNNLSPNFLLEANRLMESESQEMISSYQSILQKQKLNGNVAAQFDYLNFDGTKTKLSDFKGKYVYIDVWATWCGPCRGEIPSLQKVEEKYKDKNIAFVSISVDVQKDLEKWKKFVSDKALGGIQLFADKDWNSEFIKAFGIDSIPRFILIDPTGKVVNADAPRPSEPKLQVLLDELLK